jgi:hypothetical protein
MFDWFNLALIGMIAAIAGFIAYAVRKTMDKVAKPGMSAEDMRKLAAQIRERDIRCPRCSRQSSAMLGTETRCKCDSCNFVFEGTKHIPD